MNYQYKDIKNGAWKKLSLCEKLANIGIMEIEQKPEILLMSI